MPRFALYAAVLGLVIAGVTLVGGAIGVTLLDLKAVYFLLTAGLTFLSAAVAYYGVTHA